MSASTALIVRHRVGSPPPTADVLGTIDAPDGRPITVAFGQGLVLLCWWPARPTAAELRRFHGRPSRR